MTDLQLPAKSNDFNASDYTRALQATGLIPPESGGSDFSRVKIDGETFWIEDEPYFSNPKTKEPAFLCRIVAAPVQQYAMWFPRTDEEGGDLARAIGRPDIAGQMCRTYDYDKPKNDRRSDTDGTQCSTCAVNMFMKKEDLPQEARNRKCSWKGELEFQLIGEDGNLASEQIHSLSLAQTSMIEWMGSYNDREKGMVSPLNFMQQLARLAPTKFPDVEAFTAIMKAQTALQNGGVIAEARLHRTQGRTAGMTYSVVSFTPIDIIPVEAPAAIATDQPAEAETTTGAATDDIPF